MVPGRSGPEAGRITAAEMMKDVTFDPADGPIDELIDDAYRAKYRAAPISARWSAPAPAPRGHGRAAHGRSLIIRNAHQAVRASALAVKNRLPPRRPKGIPASGIIAIWEFDSGGKPSMCPAP